jgi:hypothetical protein
MRVPGFIGPTFEARSVNANTERVINLYPEVVGGTPKAPLVLLHTPGTRLFAQRGGGPVRGLFAQDGRAFAVSGGEFVEVFASGLTTVRGLVYGGWEPVTICSNGAAGHQLFITSHGYGYIFDLVSGTFTGLTDPSVPSPIRMGAFCDGYFLALVGGTGTLRYSALEDGLTWDTLDVIQRSYGSDAIEALVVNHRELWMFGSRTSEVWYDSGDADTPFVPIQGTFIEHGIAAPWSAVRVDNTIFWIGQDERGAGVVWRAQGYTPIRVSTHAIERWLASVPLAQVLGWSYQDEGHTCYWLYVPDLETALVYDLATDLWHERAHWDTTRMRWIPHVARCHAWGFNRHLVGDRQSGAIYALDLDALDDELVGVN